jgi:hypothetical protein
MHHRLSPILVWIAPFVFFLCSSCMEEKIPEVHFVIPDDYRGSFTLEVDSEHGMEVVPEHDKYNFIIPKESVLKVKGDLPLFHRVKITASYENGTKIPTAYSFNMFSDDTLAVIGPYEGEQSDGTKFTFVIATIGEVKKTFGYKKK